MKRLVFFFGAVAFVVVLTLLLVFYGRGYRLNLSSRRIAGTGIIAITSTPSDASVYLDGQFKNSTNTNIENLTPGKYDLRITKDGFSSWEKQISVTKEKVTPVNVLLFPLAPSLSALTYTGVSSPKISPDGQKIAYHVQGDSTSGLWTLDLGQRSFIFSKSTKQIAQDSSDFIFSKSAFTWSPDSKSILTSAKDSSGKLRNYLLDTSKLNENFVDISGTSATLKEGWDSQVKSSEEEKLRRLGIKAQALAKGADQIIFSPDNHAVIIVKNGKSSVVYDARPSLDPTMKPKVFEIPAAASYIWYPSNNDIILVKKHSISIVDLGGTNDTTIYTGDFEEDAVFPWPDGSKLVIASALNTTANKKPNLYSISLR